MLFVFTAGLTIGWFGNSWLQPGQLNPADSISGISEATATQAQNLPDNYRQPTEPGVDKSVGVITNTNNAPGNDVQRSLPASRYNSTGESITDTFNQLLSDRRYQDAINLYQEQQKQNTQIAAQLKIDLINQLQLLKKARNNNDFSALIEHYLSVYYDDVDILLLLAEFNQANGSYLEAVDVYLLAKTYAYTDIDQQKILNRFNDFVDKTDRSYTNQSNWWSLINFYSHVNNSGLMTSSHQYLQALAHLRSGDKAFAIEQFNQLLSDSLVGESAALALNSLDNQTTAPTIDTISVKNHSESIALEKIGNQYAVNLTSDRQDKVRLLIDTGASMTAISSGSFSSLGIGTNAVVQDRRVFQTAGGVVMGTVYTVSKLRLGPYLLEDTQVAVIDFEPGRGIDGLLGMNILGQFRFQIDQENTQLHLTKK